MEKKNMSLKDALLFNNRNEWRTWLENNHKSMKEIWLLHYKKQAGKQRLNHKDAVEEALCFGWIDSKLKKIDEERFILKYSPRKPKSVWSKVKRLASPIPIGAELRGITAMRTDRVSSAT
jgi:uncharacterized protein YdeI (YjbR/CyaY-like superfamily)